MNSAALRAKRFDVYRQAAMVLIPLLLAAVTSYGIIFILVTLGGWQLISFLAHLIGGSQPWLRPARRAYGTWLLFFAAFGLAALAVRDIVLFFLVAMFIGGISLGIGYFVISVLELRTLRSNEANPSTAEV